MATAGSTRAQMSEHEFFIERFATPTGPMLLVTDAAQRVRAADWADKEQRMSALLRRYYRAGVHLRELAEASVARRALLAYFEGDRAAIDSVPVDSAGTDFQRLVWSALRRIPLGEVVSYGALANRIGRPGASRAVGLANGSNPISIFVPCHRVIGANAALTGYGGGLERKRWLLAHEGVPVAETRAAPTQLAISMGGPGIDVRAGR
jgi:methylated-DNA-[protein]-cysteine S-methyltransferase